MNKPPNIQFRLNLLEMLADEAADFAKQAGSPENRIEASEVEKEIRDKIETIEADVRAGKYETAA